MAEEKSHFFKGLEAVQITVQIIAILVAGYWTYWKFNSNEAHISQPIVEVCRDLSAPMDLGGSCLRTFNVSFKNTGKSVLTVDKVVTHVWKFYLERDKDVELVDLDKIEAQPWIFEKQFPDLTYRDTKNPK